MKFSTAKISPILEISLFFGGRNGGLERHPLPRTSEWRGGHCWLLLILIPQYCTSTAIDLFTMVRLVAVRALHVLDLRRTNCRLLISQW